jgi:hypothetical protein
MEAECSSKTSESAHRTTWYYNEEDRNLVEFEVFTTVTLKSAVFWIVTPCRNYTALFIVHNRNEEGILHEFLVLPEN